MDASLVEEAAVHIAEDNLTWVGLVEHLLALLFCFDPVCLAATEERVSFIYDIVSNRRTSSRFRMCSTAAAKVSHLLGFTP